MAEEEILKIPLAVYELLTEDEPLAGYELLTEDEPLAEYELPTTKSRSSEKHIFRSCGLNIIQ